MHTLENLQQLRSIISKILHSIHMEEKLKNQVLLACSEALTNSIEHGNASTIEVQFTKDHAQWVLHISDNGSAFNPLDFQQPDPAAIFEFNQSEGGRGVYLIKTLCDHFDYCYENQQNQLFINWHRAAESQ